MAKSKAAEPAGSTEPEPGANVHEGEGTAGEGADTQQGSSNPGVPDDVSGLMGAQGAFGAPTASGSGGVGGGPRATKQTGKTKKIHLPGRFPYTYEGRLYGPSKTDEELVEVPEGFTDPAEEEEATEAPEGASTRDELEAMTVPELKKLAAKREIDVPAGSLKEDYVDALS